MRRLAAGALMVLAIATPAHSDQYEHVARTFANEAQATHVYADQMLWDALAAARQYWRGPGDTVLRVYDETDGYSVAWGDTPGRVVRVDRAWRNAVWAEANDRAVSRVERRLVLGDLCAVLTHELGHNQGFDHQPTGVMHSPPTVTPAPCRAWARRVLPNRDKRKRAH